MPNQIQAPDGSMIEFPDTMDDATITSAMQRLFPPGMGALGAAPGAGAPPPPPGELNPNQPQNFWTSPQGLIRSGGRHILSGAARMTEPGMPAKYAGASDILRGTGEALAPAAIGAAIPAAVAAPAATAAGITGGAVGAGVGSLGARGVTSLAGGSPEAQQLAGDVGAAAGGVVGGALGSGVGSGVSKLINVLKDPRLRSNPDVQDAALKLIPFKGKDVAGLSKAVRKALAPDEPPPPPPPIAGPFRQRRARWQVSTGIRGASPPPEPPPPPVAGPSTGIRGASPPPEPPPPPVAGPTTGVRGPSPPPPAPIISKPVAGPGTGIRGATPVSSATNTGTASTASTASTAVPAPVSSTPGGGAPPGPPGGRNVPWPARYDAHNSPANAYAVDQKVALQANAAGVTSRDQLTLDKVNELRKAAGSRPLKASDTSRINDLWSTMQGQ